MKKILITALIISMEVSTFVPLASIAVETKIQTQPTQFKSYAAKDKVSNDYKYAYINLDWWSQFDDEILNDYINLAIKNNQDLKMATINVEEYYQNVKIQFSNQLPQVGGGFAPNIVKMPGSVQSDWAFATPAIMSYEADIFLKNRDKTQSVKKAHETSKFDERAAYIAVASAVGTTYFNVVKMDKTIELQEEIVKTRQTIYDLMMSRNELGLTSTSDTIKANKALVSGQTDLIELKKQRNKLLNQLAVLIGESPSNSQSLERTSLDNLKYGAKIPSEISSEVVMQRPDYLKAEKMVEKAGIDVKVARKEFLPTINLAGVALFNSSDLGSMFTTKSMLWALGGAAILPIFTGGKRVANLKLKKAQYERILQNYYKTNLVALQEINDAMVSINMDKDKMNRTLRQAKLEAQDYNYNEMKFKEGLISNLDLIQRKENLLSINKLVAQQKVECMVDSIGLYKATGSQI